MDFKKLSKIADAVDYKSLIEFLKPLGCVSEDGTIDELKLTRLAKEANAEVKGKSFDRTVVTDGCGVCVKPSDKYATDMEFWIGDGCIIISHLKGGKIKFYWHISKKLDKILSEASKIEAAIKATDFNSPHRVLEAFNTIIPKKECAEIVFDALKHSFPKYNKFAAVGYIRDAQDQKFVGSIKSNNEIVIITGDEKSGTTADDALVCANENLTSFTDHLQFANIDRTEDGNIVVEPLIFHE